MTVLDNLKAAGEAPEWLLESGYAVLSKGYLQPGETPKGMWRRVADTAAYQDPLLHKYAEPFFQLFWKGWLGGSTPLLANMGTKNLPIACFSQYVPDTTIGIFDKIREAGMLSKWGGGTAGYFSDLRPSGSAISTGGTTDGPMGFLKMFDSMIIGTSQGGTRRGSYAAYMDVSHPDIHDFLKMRLPEGDVNRQCLNLNHGVCISDSWMQRAMEVDGPERKTWLEILKSRNVRGQPYIFFTDTVNADLPQGYIERNMKVTHSNLCSEITGFTDEFHTFVCCLASMNLARWEEWKDTDAVFLSGILLDCVISQFLKQAEGIEVLRPAYNFAKKSRMIGLGAAGFHTLLQSEMTVMGSLRSKILNKAIFSHIQEKSILAARHLADLFGEPEWCQGTGLRSTRRIAIAPTESNSFLLGELSLGIEPLNNNLISNKKAKGTFVGYNPVLKKLITARNVDEDAVFSQLIKDEGSVKNLSFLTPEEKQVFLTAFEIDQRILIDLASDRQKFIDQSQSLNLFFTKDADPNYIHSVHKRAWTKKVKTLYYQRSESAIQADIASRKSEKEERVEPISTECVDSCGG